MNKDEATVGYKVSWSHTSQVETFASYDEAIAAVRSVLSGAVIGHSGDCDGGGNRTLFWPSEDLAADDDGSRAAGTISRLYQDLDVDRGT